MAIKQFNGSYSPIEDRLTLRISTSESEEYLLCLTRRQTLVLVALLEKVADLGLSGSTDVYHSPSPRVISAIREFRKESIAESTEFSKPYQPAPAHPLGPDAVFVIGCTLHADPQFIRLDLVLQNKQALSLSLEAVSTYQFCLLLKKLLDKSGWLTNTPLATGSLTNGSEGQDSHESKNGLFNKIVH
ncbi:MAG: hypothetical protein ACK443_06490 [Methylococcaceae bacterium]|jgi:hypothetical protein